MSDRFYIPPAQWDASSLRLIDDEAKHCSQVMRHREGDEVIVFNGVGDVAHARIASVKKHEVALDCIAIERIEPPAVRITLAPALIKADRWEWLLEKATELGVTEIQPLITGRCVVKLGADDAARKHDKWQRLIIEASKQCRRAWVPTLQPVCRLDDWTTQETTADLSLVAALDKHTVTIKQAARAFCERTSRSATSSRVVIGPEGDFTRAELSELISRGFTCVSLGALTLRAETASIAAIAVLSAELNTEH